MKKLFVILIFFAFCFARAGAQSMLKVSLSDRSVINVAVDGRYFNKHGQSVTVGDLPQGRHNLKIYAASGNGGQEVIFSGNVRTYRGAITMFVMDANTGMTDIQEQDMNTYTSPQQVPNTADNSNYNQGGSYNNNQNNNIPDNNYQNNQQNNSYQNNDNSGAPVASPLSSDELPTLTDSKIDNLKTKVAAKKTDTEKLAVLKDALKNEKVSTDQISAIMDWFIFESSKVTFAEAEFPNTVDKENFSGIDNKFSYKASQDELDKFISNNKQ